MHTPLSVLLMEKGNVVHHISPGASCFECALKMNQFGIGALLVLSEEDKIVGIISERDMIRKVVGAQLDPSTVSVEQVMTKEPMTVSPETTVREAMKIVTDLRFRHLPVVLEGKLQGLISIGDLTKWAIQEQEREIHALTDYIQGDPR